MELMHYGLQRSGTNFLRRLLEKNYKVNFLNSNKNRSSPLQKHFRLYDNKEIIPEPQYKNNIYIKNFKDFEKLISVPVKYYIIISKDPYSWYLSYKRWAEKCNWPKVSHHYIEEYNLFYQKWIKLSHQTDKIIFVKYIDLLKETDLELRRIENLVGMNKKWFVPFISNRISKVSQSSKFTKEKRNYYIQQEYLETYSEKDLKKLNNVLDKELTQSLGYEIKNSQNI